MFSRTTSEKGNGVAEEVVMKTLLLCSLLLVGCYSGAVRQNPETEAYVLVDNFNASTVKVFAVTQMQSRIYVGRVLSGSQERLRIPNSVDINAGYTLICENPRGNYDISIAPATARKVVAITVADPIRHSRYSIFRLR